MSGRGVRIWFFLCSCRFSFLPNKPDLVPPLLILLLSSAAMEVGVGVAGACVVVRLEALLQGSPRGAVMGACFGSWIWRTPFSSSSFLCSRHEDGEGGWTRRFGACCLGSSLFSLELDVELRRSLQSDRWAVFANPVTFLAEWRLSLFLPAQLPKGRQYNVFLVVVA